MQENLNIDANKKLLVLKALNKHGNQHGAARDLGMSQSGLNRLTARYRIFKQDGVYVERELKRVNPLR